jgi:hypothetical protein
MSRFSEFTIDELHAIIFRLNLAQTVEPLDELAASIREEMLEELRLRNIDPTNLRHDLSRALNVPSARRGFRKHLNVHTKPNSVSCKKSDWCAVVLSAMLIA